MAIEDLVVDLSDRTFETTKELWPVLMEHCRLPDWFGKNQEAWRDSLVSGGVSLYLDSRRLVLTVRGAGIFAPGSEVRKHFEDDFAEAGDHAELRIVD